MEIHFLPFPPNNLSSTPTFSDEDNWSRHQSHECSCHWISGEEEEPFTIETLAFLLKSHRSSHKDLLLAMVTTLSDQHIDLESNSVAVGSGGSGGRKEFKSIYQAQALNHVLFRTCEEPASLLPNSIHLQSKSFGWNARQTVHRLSHVRNVTILYFTD